LAQVHKSAVSAAPWTASVMTSAIARVRPVLGGAGAKALAVRRISPTGAKQHAGVAGSWRLYGREQGAGRNLPRLPRVIWGKERVLSGNSLKAFRRFCNERKWKMKTSLKMLVAAGLLSGAAALGTAAPASAATTHFSFSIGNVGTAYN